MSLHCFLILEVVNEAQQVLNFLASREFQPANFLKKFLHLVHFNKWVLIKKVYPKKSESVHLSLKMARIQQWLLISPWLTLPIFICKINFKQRRTAEHNFSPNIFGGGGGGHLPSVNGLSLPIFFWRNLFKQLTTPHIGISFFWETSLTEPILEFDTNASPACLCYWLVLI